MKRKTSVKREDDDDARSDDARGARGGASAYETDDALTQYLEFHYARSDSYDGDIQHGRPPRFAGTLPASGFVEKEGCEGCHEFVPFPVRCTWFLMNALRASPKFLSRSDEGEKMRALDVGCAVGGATIELARKRCIHRECYETFFGYDERTCCGYHLLSKVFWSYRGERIAGWPDVWGHLPRHGKLDEFEYHHELAERVKHAEFVFDEVVGFDSSAPFIEAAKQMRDEKERRVDVPMEGGKRESMELSWFEDAPFIDWFKSWATEKHLVDFKPMTKCTFEVGDACSLEYWKTLGKFDAVLVANLLCRLPRPRACLDGLATVCNPGAVVVFCTPWSWLDEYTPDKRERLDSAELVSEMKTRGFEEGERDYDYEIPCFIREHYRKVQYIISQVHVFIKQ